MATVKNSYRASSDLTFTSLDSLVDSPTLIAGAESTAYDNTTNLDIDAKLSGQIKVSGTIVANGQVLIYVVAESKDGTWPDVLDGTDSAETWTVIEMRDACAKLAAVINVVDTTADRVYPFECGSVADLFGGILPKKFVVWVTHNCGVSSNLGATGNFVSVSGLQRTVA